MPSYQRRIAGITDKYPPRLIEAWMRLERGTLDGLAPSQFRAEVEISVECIDAAGIPASETLAQSFGL